MSQLLALMVVVALTSLGAYSSCNNREVFSWDGRKGEISVSHGSANGETTRSYKGEGGPGPARMPATGRTDNAAVFVELSVDEGTFELQFSDVDSETGKVLRVEGGERSSLEFELPASVIDRGEYRIVAKDAKGVKYTIVYVFSGRGG